MTGDEHELHGTELNGTRVSFQTRTDTDQNRNVLAGCLYEH